LNYLHHEKELKMNSNKIGISDIGIYIPSGRIKLDQLIRERVESSPKLARHLDRAAATTGQRAIRFPSPWEDTATMAAQAARDLLVRRGEAELAGLRFLVAGTETTVDHSKPVSAYVQGMLQRSGLEIPASLSSFQVQHACAGGTLSAVNVASLLAVGNRDDEFGIVVASDIARYQPESTAEITQGAGAISLLIEPGAKLIELDLATVGYCSQDVDDFFRPLGSTVAQVKGRYSMQVYQQSLKSAFLDHCRRAGEDPKTLLKATDLFVLHTPFRNMPELAMKSLLDEHLGLSGSEAEAFLRQRGFFRGLDPIADIGNTYSASMFLFLAFLLKDRFEALGEDIVGKRILLASYGSGNTMIVLSGTVAPMAPRVIESWDLERIFASACDAGMGDYEIWTAGPRAPGDYAAILGSVQVPTGAFYLSGVREDGYREYNYAADSQDWLPKAEEAAEPRRSVPAPVQGPRVSRPAAPQLRSDALYGSRDPTLLQLPG
jgi:hydroxymethylglutaryl-CoA synthase